MTIIDDINRHKNRTGYWPIARNAEEYFAFQKAIQEFEEAIYMRTSVDPIYAWAIGMSIWR